MHTAVMWYPLQSASLSCVKILPIETKQCLPPFDGKSCANSTCEHFQHTCWTTPPFPISCCDACRWESQKWSNLWQVLKYSPEMVHSHCCQGAWEFSLSPSEHVHPLTVDIHLNIHRNSAPSWKPRMLLTGISAQ